MANRANQKADEEQSRHGGVDRDQAQNKVRGKAEELKNRIPDEHRERIANTIGETKDFLDEQFPEERRDQFIYRLKKVVVECQEHSDYQEAMEWLLQFFESELRFLSNRAFGLSHSRLQGSRPARHQQGRERCRLARRRPRRVICHQPVPNPPRAIRQWQVHARHARRPGPDLHRCPERSAPPRLVLSLR